MLTRGPVIFLNLIALLLMLNGCTTVGPDYKAPEMQPPEKWQKIEDPSLKPDKTDIREWWKIFDDPMLSRLIAMAADSNHDLRIAVARVNEARARLGIISGQTAPVVNAVSGGTTNRAGGETGAADAPTHTRFSAGLDASWEIDLFGRISRSVETETAELQAAAEDRNDVMVTMYAEVARTYLEIRTLQARLSSANGNIASQKDILKLTQKRFKHGLATALDVAQAERVLASSEAAVPPLRIQLNQDINTMGVLMGRAPGHLYKELSKVSAIPLPPASVAVGVPADLLRQRPDIRKVERHLAAQTARIGVATADLYPTLSLSGSINIGFSDMVTGGSTGFSFGPSLRWNVFDRSRIRNQIKVEDARTEQALLNYEKTVLNALNEVENAMTAFLEQRIQYEAQQRAAAAAKKSLKLSAKLYKDGLIAFQTVLDAQLALFDFENQVAEAQGNAAANVVRLYKSLGGGWNPDAIATDDDKNSPAQKKKSDDS
ncbi:efflux transporter outer membrane subunit [Desulfococcaceae bacterium HSG7]|nr:efflux transporter outer membrane subunit [Desulfococcaceae bacterium HSG7]